MPRARLAAMVPLPALVLLCGLSFGSFVSCTSAEAEAEGTGRLEQVRLGFALDGSGRVSTGLAATSFSLTDPIHLSLEVTGATAGSSVIVSVRDVVTQRVAWREERPVPAGGSFQTFEIGRGIELGSYRLESTLGGGATQHRPFVVHPQLRSSR
jgi:plasmid stability protein